MKRPWREKCGYFEICFVAVRDEIKLRWTAMGKRKWKCRVHSIRTIICTQCNLFRAGNKKFIVSQIFYKKMELHWWFILFETLFTKIPSQKLFLTFNYTYSTFSVLSISAFSLCFIFFKCQFGYFETISLKMVCLLENWSDFTYLVGKAYEMFNTHSWY